MAFLKLQCSKCGGELKQKGDFFECGYCHTTYLNDQIEKETAALRAILDEQKQEQLANRRHMLWEAIHAEYIDSEMIVDLCRSLRKLKPDDFEARFFEVANSGNGRELNRFIDSIDVKNPEEKFWAEEVVKFTIKSLRAENILSLNDLIERAYKDTDLEKYEKYATHVSDEAKKVEGGIYEPSLPRDVFVMYSSKDFKKVKELVYHLEESGLKCFVAMRNLQHGRGAVANYQRALETAMDNCKVIVFLSSRNSRALDCDAMRVEMPYLKRKDIENAPYEYRQHYDKMPQKYKKPRVEYRLDNEKTGGAGLVKEFFGELEFAYSADEVLNRVVQALTASVEEKPQEKICVSCGAKNPLQTKFCMECGGREFASTEEEYERKKQDKNKEAIERAERENAALLAKLKAMEEAQKKEAEQKALAAEEEAKKRAEEAEKANRELLERLKKLEEEQKKTSVSAVSAGKKTAEGSKPKAAVEVAVGGTVTLGSYAQGDNGEKRPVEWIVLKKEGSKALLISKFALDCKPYYHYKVDTTWESSSIRSWLNGEFLNAAFTDTERQKIQTTNVVTLDNASRKTKGGNPTNDRIFLLSIEEAKEYFSSDNKRKCEPTAYAVSRHANRHSNGCGSWWLRSPGYSQAYAAYVSFDGGMSDFGATVYNTSAGSTTAFGETIYESSTGVRPAFWMDLGTGSNGSLEAEKKAVEKKTTGKTVEKKTSNAAPMSQTNVKTTAKKADEAKYFVVRIADREYKSPEFLETVKELTGCSLTEAQKLISDGQPLKRGLTEVDAQAYVELLEEFGSKIEIVPDTRPVSEIEAERKKEAGTASTAAKTAAKPAAKPVATTPQVKDFGPAFEVKDGVLIKYKGAGGNVVVPPGVIKIGSEAFKMAKEVTGVKIPDSVTVIDSFAFQFCGKLTEVTVPNSVTEIGSAAFQYCGRLAKVNIPDSVKSMGTYQFAGCGELKEVAVGANNPEYRSIDGNLYTKDGKTLLYYAKGKTASSFTLPDSVEKIEPYAFAGCKNLTEVVLPSGLKTIGNYAFVDCYMLRTIVIPTSVKTVGAQSFQGCTALKGDPVQTWQAARKKAENESAKAVEANYPYVCVRVTDRGKSGLETAGIIRQFSDCSFEESYNIVKNKEIFARGLTNEEAKKYVTELEKLGAKGAVETDMRTAATVEAERKAWTKQVDERILDGRKETERRQQSKQAEEDRRNHEVSKPFSDAEQQALKNFTRGEVLKCDQKTAFFGVFPQHKAAGVPSDLKTNPTAYEAFKGEYYIVEPIKWRILEETDKELYLFSDRGLDCMAYSLKSNVYENSAIRAWLNKDFLNRAFTVAEREKLVADSLGDKVTLIARDELMDKRLGFAAQPKESDDSRVVWASEYSRAKGAAHAMYWTKTAYNEGNGAWSNSTWVYMVNRFGEIGANGVENQKDHSIVPVIRVSKTAPMSQTKAKATVLASPSKAQATVGAPAKTPVKAKALTLKEQADVRFAQGMELYNQRKYMEALKILQEDPLLKTHGEALYMVGYCYELGLGRLKDLRRATEFYQNAKRNGYQKAEDGVLRIRRSRRAEGVCQYCGGAFKGLFTKTCSYCGMKKDY